VRSMCRGDSTGVAIAADGMGPEARNAPGGRGLSNESSRVGPLGSSDAPETAVARVGVEGGIPTGTEPLPTVWVGPEAGFGETARSPIGPVGTDCIWGAMRGTRPGSSGATVCTTSLPAIGGGDALATSI
jgi:hypothetical protein